MGNGLVDVRLPREILAADAFMASIQYIHDAPRGIGGVCRFDQGHVARYDFWQSSGAGDYQILADGARFGGRESKALHERRHDHRVYGRNVFAQFRVFYARYPGNVGRNAQRVELGTYEIGSSLFVSRNDEHGMEIRYRFQYFGNGFDNVLKPFGNPGAAKVENRFLVFYAQFGAQVPHPARIHVGRVPKFGVHAVVHGGQPRIGHSKQEPEAVFSVVGDAEHLSERKEEDRPLEKLENEPFGPHEAVPELSKHFVHREYDRFARQKAEHARRDGGRVRSGMDDVGVFGQRVSRERNPPHEPETVGTPAVHLNVFAHPLVLGNAPVMPAGQHRYAVPALGQTFDDVLEKDFGSADMRNVIVENEEDFHAAEYIENARPSKRLRFFRSRRIEKKHREIRKRYHHDEERAVDGGLVEQVLEIVGEREHEKQHGRHGGDSRGHGQVLRLGPFFPRKDENHRESVPKDVERPPRSEVRPVHF